VTLQPDANEAQRDADDQRINDTSQRACAEAWYGIAGTGVRTERLGERRVGLWASRWQLAQALQDKTGEAGRNLPAHRTRGRGRLVIDAGDQIAQIRLFEGRSSRQEVIEGGADRVDVGPHIEGLAAQLLRRGELRGALKSTLRQLEAHVAAECRDREAEVADLDRALVVDEAVRGLYVAM
jgi:hypothetical protein